MKCPRVQQVVFKAQRLGSLLVPRRLVKEHLFATQEKQDNLIHRMAKRSCCLLVLVAVSTMLWIGNCEEKCGENMEYSKCRSKSTCDDVAKMIEANAPAANCVPGCSCKDEFVLLNGRCIPKSTCTCPNNAEYRCRKCERTCEAVTSMGPPKVCTMLCRLGCECKEKYVLESGKCIPQKECRCQPNSEYKENGACQRTCEDVASMSSEPCTTKGMAGCYCKHGYALKDTVCIPQEKCPCKKNAKYSECSTTCPLTCNNYKNPPKNCDKSCYVGCACEKGFVKSGAGACVRPEECSYTS